MGYYTQYSLTVLENKDENIDYESEISTISGYSNPFDNSCKWYSHESDMKEYSESHPNTLFLLEGEGEESGDLWRKYFKNGKMQVCKAQIFYEPYDESKLI